MPRITQTEINRMIMQQRLKDLTIEEKFQHLSEALENPSKCFHDFDEETCKFCGLKKPNLYD